MIRYCDGRPDPDSRRNLESDARVIPVADASGADACLHLESRAGVVRFADSAGFHVRVDLDARALRRALRRGLHGGVPFGFASLVFKSRL